MAEEKRPLIASRAQAGGLRSQAAEPSGSGAARSPGSRTASRESQGTVHRSKMSHDEQQSTMEGNRTPRPDEEKQHQEVVLRRPLAHRLEHQKRWSWGAGGLTETGDRRTTSTSHLKQHADSSRGSKRLSSSSLERASARVPMSSRSGDRQKAQSPSPATGGSDGTQKKEKEKRFPSPGAKRPASPSSVPRAASPGPGAPFSAQRRPPSPPSARQGSCRRPPSPGTGRQQPPSPQPSCRAPPLQRPALTPTGPPTLRKRDAKQKDGSPVQLLPPYCQDTPGGSIAPNTKTKDDSGAKPIAGSTSAEEAARILSENRRLAREQKEKQEQLRMQREEEDRLRKEQERRLAEEERARRLEEERIRAEERKKEEEEQTRLAEEQRQWLEAEELQRRVEVQREREEAEARATEEAERQRRERERILQKNQQERMQRRKRIEEIMRRTRKADQSDCKREEKGMLDENEEEDHEAKEEDLKEIRDDSEVTSEGWGWPEQKPVALQDLSVCGVTRRTDNKETMFQQEPMAVSPAPKTQQMEEGPNSGSLATQKCRVGSWSFEELIDKGVHPKTWPVIGGDVCNAEDPPEDRALNPSQPVEALSEL